MLWERPLPVELNTIGTIAPATPSQSSASPVAWHLVRAIWKWSGFVFTT